METFRARKDRGIIILPGFGKIDPDTILIGEKYRQFCPNFLEVVPEGRGSDGSGPAASVLRDVAAEAPASGPIATITETMPSGTPLAEPVAQASAPTEAVAPLEETPEPTAPMMEEAPKDPEQGESGKKKGFKKAR